MNNKPKTQAICRVIAGAILFFHAWLVLDLIPRWSATDNEPGHIAAGLANWYSGNYSLYCVNPPMPRMVATIPLLSEPVISLAALTLVDRPRRERREIEIGQYFADTNALYYHELVCRARLAGVFWITLGGIIVWRWSTSLFGQLGGLLSLILWTFEATITAHSGVATADMPAAVMGLAATYVFAYFLRTGSSFHVFVAGVLLGLALLCKFTLLLLVPTWSFAWWIERRRRNHEFFGMTPGWLQLTKAVVIGLLAWLILNMGYEFDGTWNSVREYEFVSQRCKAVSDLIERSGLSHLPCLFPSAYISGIDLQQVDFEGRLMSYVRGEWSEEGWWWYYVYAFAIKTPIGHLAIYGLGIITTFMHRQRTPTLAWLSPLLIVVAASSKTGFTEHLRYILPAYPYIMILSGIVLSDSLLTHRLRRGIVAAGLVCSATGMSLSYPHFLGYFNQTIGGSKQGWRHLAESNVCWGQDSIFLRDWLITHSELRPVYVSLSSHMAQRVYLRQRYPHPEPTKSGYAIVDAYGLTREYKWLLSYPLVETIGTSVFVFRVAP